MGFLNNIKERMEQNNIDRTVFSLLATLLVIVGLLVAAGILFPTAVSMILNVVWTITIAAVIVFFVLGILVIFGMRKEVGRILDILLEGSLTFIDFLNFIKSLWKRFVEILKEFLLFAAPIFAYILSFLLYLLFLLIYKTVGKTYDVTLLTFVITAVLVTSFGIISKPTFGEEQFTWKALFGKRFKSGLVDGLEVILFVFFITMDSTNLFFLPDSLNVELHAQLGNYNLMTRSFVYNDNLRITVNIIAATIILELVRNLIRIFAAARKHYMNFNRAESEAKAVNALKQSIRMSFDDNKDDFIKFITFNTVLFAVFLLFPRLKLLTLLVTSVCNLFLDIFIRTRLYNKRGTDLISRVLAKIFRI